MQEPIISPANTFRSGARLKLQRADSVGLSRETAGLTPREAEIATWLAHGKTNWEISVISGVSVRTVEKHVERILHKLGVENRTAAVVALIEQRLLP